MILPSLQQPALRHLMIVQCLFFMGMWMSKLVHPLWFAHHQQLQVFSYGYAAMALCGYASPLLGRIIDHYGPRRTIRWGLILYASGLLLRIYPHAIVVVMISGLIAGLGASAVLIAIRSWTKQLSMTCDSTALVGTRDMLRAIACAAGMLIAGIIPSVIPTITTGYCATLILAAVVVASGCIPLRTSEEALSHPPAPESLGAQDHQHNLSEARVRYALIGCGLLAGLSTSFVTPYLPLILHKMHFSLLSIGGISAITMLVSAASYPVIVRWLGKNAQQHHSRYLGLEFIHFSTLIVLAYTGHTALVLLALCIRAFVLCACALCEEQLWLMLFPTHNAGRLFGWLQGAFFAGDSIGGILAARLLEQFTQRATLIAAAGTLVLYTMGISLLMLRTRNSFARAPS